MSRYRMYMTGGEARIQREASVLPPGAPELVAWLDAGNTFNIGTAEREAIFEAFKGERNRRLSLTDWALLSDVVSRGTLTQTQQDAYVSYRHDLYWAIYYDNNQEQPKSVEDLARIIWPTEPVV